MRKQKFLAFAAAAIFLGAHSLRAANSPDSALTGQVSSAEEGMMEGVLVSAKRAGSTITITVVSNSQGRYTFPAAKLEPGQYSLNIRAAGYDLDGRATANVAPEKTAAVDLRLRKALDLPAQLTNAEWIASAPGTQQQKNTLLSCVGCHSIERIVRSKYDTEGFMQTLKRMSGYANQSTPLHPQLRLGERDTAMVGEEQARVQRSQAEWLSTINLSSTSTWQFPAKNISSSHRQSDAGHHDGV